MLPVYDAIGVKEIITKGGSTRPWLMEVLVKDQPETYVVKLFTEKQLDQYSAVANEVYANVLAQELGLKCPKAALIKFPENFNITLTEEQQQELSKKDKRIKFGSSYITGATTYNQNINLSGYDIESVYAFDSLIINWDRRIKKPNILIKKDNFFLIDHELSLQYSQEHIVSFNQGILFHKHMDHIFYHLLKQGKNNDQKHYFNEFGEYLKVLNVNKLENYKNQLYELDHPIGYFQLIKKYLTLLKKDYNKFIQLLRNTLQ